MFGMYLLRTFYYGTSQMEFSIGSSKNFNYTTQQKKKHIQSVPSNIDDGYECGIKSPFVESFHIFEYL